MSHILIKCTIPTESSCSIAACHIFKTHKKGMYDILGSNDDVKDTEIREQRSYHLRYCSTIVLEYCTRCTYSTCTST